MRKTLMKRFALVGVVALCIKPLLGFETANQNQVLQNNTTSMTSSPHRSLGGLKRPHSSVSHETVPALLVEDIFNLISSYLRFKQYISGLSASCLTFRHWAIGRIVGFSQHDEPHQGNDEVPSNEKWTRIPKCYTRLLMKNKNWITAFTSLEYLDLSNSCLQIYFPGLEDMGEFFINVNSDPNNKYERLYPIRGQELCCFTNLRGLDLTKYRLIESGEWARDLTSLRSLRISIDDEEENEDTGETYCIDSALEKFPNLRELHISYFTPLNYENIFGLTNLTHLVVDEEYMYHEYFGEYSFNSPYYHPHYTIRESGLLWEKLPNLERYEYYPKRTTKQHRIVQTRDQFIATKEAEKAFIANFKRENLKYTFRDLNHALTKFRQDQSLTG